MRKMNYKSIFNFLASVVISFPMWAYSCVPTTQPQDEHLIKKNLKLDLETVSSEISNEDFPQRGQIECKAIMCMFLVRSAKIHVFPELSGNRCASHRREQSNRRLKEHYIKFIFFPNGIHWGSSPQRELIKRSLTNNSKYYEK